LKKLEPARRSPRLVYGEFGIPAGLFPTSTDGNVREDFQLGRIISTPGAEWDPRRPGRGIRPLTRDVDSPSWCFVTARDALKEDSIVGDAPQVVVTAEAAECFMHQHGERPHYRTDIELVTVKYQPGMNVYQHESPPSSIGTT
jgi:hypothetical protein